YKKYLEFGADIVVAHHPHVPMNYERIGEKMVFYSLGNFIFDTDYQRAQLNTDAGILLKINFTEADYTYEAFGTKIERGKENIVAGPVAAIFEDIREEEYEKLMPMAAKAFISNEKKKVTFLNPKKHADFTEEQWHDFFKGHTRVKGWLYDMEVYEKLASQAENGEFEKSSLDGVKHYIMEYFKE
ncbi:MAG: CapA family protein, partial [Eubacterium sp.]|nr:CapA family protein [Eubacterium sp.]